ncbi:MAG TPA: hypothetical protein VIM11_01185 [Tepidisphaeraceae bacterium]|jgi:hypothetical protein
MIVILALGGLLRVRQYSAGTSFFSDEAALVLNFRTHSTFQLLRQLDHGQAAPPAFLWIGRLAYRSFGPNEYALRLLPLMGGLLALGLFAHIAWRLFPAGVAVAVVGWFAFCNTLIMFCAELKQYSTDVMVAVTLFGIAFVWGADQSPLRRLAILSGVASITVWLSHPTAILYGAFALVLLWQCRSSGTRAFALALLCGCWVGVSFLTLYFLSIQHLQSRFLYNFWRNDFPDWSRPLNVPGWLARETYALIDDPYRSLGIISVPLTCCGIAWLWMSRQRDLLAALLLPIGLTALAACLHQYPYNGSRLTLFLCPGLFLLIGFGLNGLRGWLPMPLRVVWWAPAAIVVSVGAVAGIGRAIHPHYQSHVRPVVEYVREHFSPGDELYLLGELGPKDDPLNSPGRHLELLAYWPDPPAEVHTSIQSIEEIHAHRFWVVLAYRPHIRQSIRLFDEFKRVADPVGEPLITDHGAAACLFELRRASATSRS